MENNSQLPLENQEEELVVSQPTQLNKMLLLLVAILSLILVGFGGYFLGIKNANEGNKIIVDQPKSSPFASPISSSAPIEDGVVCAMDAMECPDGSYVGRTGPDCEFKCPGVQAK